MTEEIWKPISGYEGKYMISNFGRVKSLNYRRTGKEKIMTPGKLRKNYLGVSLTINGKSKTFKVHRLVAEAFIPNTKNLPLVNHKDENTMNNCADNLEWCDNTYNVRYSQAKKVGQFRNNKLIKIWDVLTDVEKEGFKKSAVCQCCKGNRIFHHGYQWCYIEN